MEIPITGRARMCAATWATLFMSCVTPYAGHADNFQKVSYDSSTDELVITVIYRGTNADHQFSVKWGPCADGDDGRHTIVGELLDQQFQDAARKNYKKTVRIGLADLGCRPAVVTLRTAPRFFYTLAIPASTVQTNRQ
jgi:hypothetical protein